MADPNSNRSRTWSKIILAIAIFVSVAFGLKALGVGEHLKQALNWVDGLGAWGPTAFVVLYIVITVGLVPGSVFTIGAGAIFGVFWGTVWVSVGSVLGASTAFLIARFGVRNWVKRKIEDNPKFDVVDDAIGKQSWKIVFLIRLSPLFPFNFLNYALGITKIGFWSHLTASWAGMLPGTVLYVYFGSITTAGVRSESGRSSFEWTFLVIGLLATVAVSIYIAKIARKAIDEKIEKTPSTRVTKKHR